jgi:hypothetical protein
VRVGEVDFSFQQFHAAEYVTKQNWKFGIAALEKNGSSVSIFFILINMRLVCKNA